MEQAMPDEPRLSDLQKMVAHFRDERDWRQFHTLKDLAAAIAIESGELQAEFLWVKDDEEEARLEQRRDQIAAELADVLILALSFADAANIAPSAAVVEKLRSNGLRYPIETARGSAAKYTELLTPRVGDDPTA